MLVNSRKDSMLIKMTQFDNNGKEQMVAAYYCNAPFEQLKIYQFCKEEEIDIAFNGEKFFIDDIIVGFGDEENGTVPAIEVIVS